MRPLSLADRETAGRALRRNRPDDPVYRAQQPAPASSRGGYGDAAYHLVLVADPGPRGKGEQGGAWQHRLWLLNDQFAVEPYLQHAGDHPHLDGVGTRV